MTNVLDETLTCDNAAMIIAFPDNEKSFYKAKIVGDFCAPYSTFNEYSNTLNLERYRQAYNALAKKFGLTVLWNSRSTDLIESMEKKRLVVLFAHQVEKRKAIEFCDGIVPADRLCSTMPTCWTGFLEASACCSDVLVEGYRQRYSKRARLGYFPRRLKTRLWFGYYYIMFKAMAINLLPFGAFLTRFSAELEDLARKKLKGRIEEGE